MPAILDNMITKLSFTFLKFLMQPKTPVHNFNCNIQIPSNAKLNKKEPRIALFDTTLAIQPIPIRMPAKNPFLVFVKIII